MAKGGKLASKKGSTSEEEMIAEAADLPNVPLARIWAVQGNDWPWFIIAVLSSCASGASQPIFSVIYSDIITIYFLKVRPPQPAWAG